MNIFIDTHAHLLDDRFDIDRASAMRRSEEAGVRTIIEVGCDPAGWDRTLLLAKDHHSIRCALGVHPQEARLATPAVLARLEELGQNETVVAIGETGLDYHYENSPKDIQKDVFIKTLSIASKLKKPVVIHCRDAYNDLLEILRSNAPLPSGVIHCFSGTIPESRELVSMGFLIGIDGPVTYPSAHTLRAVVKEVALKQLVLETDSPYLTPQKFRGARNEPSHLPLIAQEIAHIKGIIIDEVASATTANARSLFLLKDVMNNG